MISDFYSIRKTDVYLCGVNNPFLHFVVPIPQRWRRIITRNFVQKP